MPELISSREAAWILGVTPPRVRELVRLGRLRPIRISQRLNLFVEADVRGLVRHAVGRPRTEENKK